MNARLLFWFSLALFLFINPVFSDDSVRVYKFTIQALEGGFVFEMPPGKESHQASVKWPEGVKSVPLRIEWLATSRRLFMKTYWNNQQVNLKGDVDSRQVTHKETECDEYKGNFQIDLSDNKDFTIQVDLVKINTDIVVSSFVIKYMVPKEMSYPLQKSIEEIFNFHVNADKGTKIFEESRNRRIKLIENLRLSLSEAENNIERLKREKDNLKKLLEGKFDDAIKQLRIEKEERDKEIARLSKALKEKSGENINLKEELERLKMLIKDRNPPEIEVLYPKEKEGGKYIANKEKILLEGIARDESDIAWIKVNDQDVSFKKFSSEDGKSIGAKFQIQIALSADQENPVTISTKDSAGNIRKETYVIVRKIPVITEYLCNQCRYRIEEQTKFCPNCGYPGSEAMDTNIVEKRFLCKACDLSDTLHTHIRIVRRKKKDIDKTPPQLTVEFPTSNYFSSRAQIEVKGKAEDNIQVEKVTIQGKEALFKGKDFSLPVELTKEGKNEITIEAIDSSGNKTRVLVPVYLDTKAPEIQILEPNWKYVFTQNLTVKGIAKDENIASVKVNGIESSINGSGNFQAKLTLVPGTKKIEVVAVDKAGNSATTNQEISLKIRTKDDDQFESNNTLEEAFPLQPGLYKDLICRDDDWYMVKVPAASILRIKVLFTHEKGDLELKLCNKLGQEIASSTGNADDEMLEKEIEKEEDCYIKIYTYEKAEKKGNTYQLFIKIISVAKPIPGLSYQGKNAAGCHEYIHDKSGLHMVMVPSAKFWLGSPNTEEGRDQDEGPRHPVYIDSYLIGKYEVTQKSWIQFMKTNPSSNTRSENLPVEKITWNEAIDFCKATELTLPTEAQWERACRAETEPSSTRSTVYFWGNTMNSKYCWFRENAQSQTQEVGKTLPNNFGICDMLGNVREWCLDWYGPYTSAFQRNPAGPTEGTNRINRGGAVGMMDQNCRSATRYGSSPNRKSFIIGFRVALPIPD